MQVVSRRKKAVDLRHVQLNIKDADVDCHTHARTHAHTHTHNCLKALCPGLPGWASTRRNIHPFTLMRKKKDSHRQIYGDTHDCARFLKRKLIWSALRWLHRVATILSAPPPPTNSAHHSRPTMTIRRRAADVLFVTNFFSCHSNGYLEY